MTYPPQYDPYRGQYSGPQGGNWQYPAFGNQPPPQPQWQQNPFGYGEHPPLGQGGAPPPNRNRHWLWLVVLAVVVLVAVAGGVAWKAGTSGTSGTPVASETSTSKARPTFTRPSTPSVPQPPPTPSPAPTGTDCVPMSAGPGTPAGWQQVGSRFGVGYDVPADWQVQSCGTRVGWEKPCPDGPFGTCPIQILSAAAELPAGAACPDSVVAMTGLGAVTDTTDTRMVATNGATLAKQIYTSDEGRIPTVALSDPQDVTFGAMRGTKVVAHVTGIQSDQCTAATVDHAVVAVAPPGQSKVIMLVMSLPQQFPGVPQPQVIDQIVSTLRPY